MKRRILSLLLAAILVFSCVSVFAEDDTQTEHVFDYTSFYASMYLNYFQALIDSVKNNYLYDVSSDDIYREVLLRTILDDGFNFDAATEELVKILKSRDKYAEFYTPAEMQSQIESFNGSFCGIGVTFSQTNNIIISVFDNSPAKAAGLLAGDRIVSVDGIDVSESSSDYVASLVRGEEGTSVIVGIERGSDTLYFDITRAPVSVSPIEAEFIDDDTAYISLSSFTLAIDEFLAPFMDEVNEKGVKNIILDLRDNGGGEIGGAKMLANYFIPEGAVANLKYKNSARNETITSESKFNASPYNLVVLCNKNSASASELFLGAVRDRRAGTIIGTHTYGKGCMQVIMSTFTGAGLKFTVADFYSPNDTAINNVGIEPDIYVENTIRTVTESDFEKINLDSSAIGKTDDETQTLAIEQRLEALNYFRGEPDGVWDEDTTKAVATFQLYHNMMGTGEPDVYFLVTLNDIEYEFDTINDVQMDAALEYLKEAK